MEMKILNNLLQRKQKSMQCTNVEFVEVELVL